jgi:hypothetical protein
MSARTPCRNLSPKQKKNVFSLLLFGAKKKLSNASKEVGLGVRAEETNLIFMSHHQTVVKITVKVS